MADGSGGCGWSPHREKKKPGYECKLEGGDEYVELTKTLKERLIGQVPLKVLRKNKFILARIVEECGIEISKENGISHVYFKSPKSYSGVESIPLKGYEAMKGLSEVEYVAMKKIDGMRDLEDYRRKSPRVVPYGEKNSSEFCFSIEDGHITYLHLQQQCLKKIPKELMELKKLKKLTIRWNGGIKKIKNLPDSLEELDFFVADIKRIKNLPEGLKRLNLGNNPIRKIKNLPEGLEYLSLWNGKMRRIRNLPDSIEELDLGSTKIKTVKNLPKNLKKLKMTHCDKVVKRIKGVPESLEEIIIHDSYRTFKRFKRDFKRRKRRVKKTLDELEKKGVRVNP